MAIGARALDRLRLRRHRQQPVAQRQGVVQCHAGERLHRLAADMLVVVGLALDHAAEGDEAVICSIALDRKLDRARQLQRAGDVQHVAGAAGLGDDAHRAVAQPVDDGGVVRRAHH